MIFSIFRRQCDHLKILIRSRHPLILMDSLSTWIMSMLLTIALASLQDPATSPALTLAPFSAHALGYSITGLLFVPWLSQPLFLFLSQGLCTCCALFLKVLLLNLLMADSVPSFGSQLKWHFLGVLSHVCLPFSMYIRPMSQGERLKLLCWLLLWLGCTFPRLYFGCNAPAWDLKMLRCSMSMQVACRLKFLERPLTGAGFSREADHNFEYPSPITLVRAQPHTCMMVHPPWGHGLWN